MSFQLSVFIAEREFGVHDLEVGQTYIVGREPPCDVVVPDRSVSRLHCELKVAADGVHVTDLNSSNGLFSRGQRVSEVDLQAGAMISLGAATLKLARPAAHADMIRATGLREAEPISARRDTDPPTGAARWGRRANDRRSTDDDGQVPAVRSAGSPAGGPDPATSSLHGGRREYERLEKERLALLIETGKSLGQSSDLEELLDRIIDHLFQILPVRRAVIALTSDDENFVPRKVMPPQASDDLSAVASQSILRSVAQSQTGKIFDDAASDQKLNANMSIVISNIRAAICAPIVFNQRCLGAIYADYPGRRGLYRPADLDFLTAFASIAAVSLENSRMVEELRMQERLRRDMEVAGEIQKGLLPQELQQFEGLDIDWTYWPSALVGGDFFDIFELDDGRIAAVLGDVSGKSVPAAIYMARTLSILRATVTAAPSPGEAMTRTNNLLGQSDGRAVFATTFIMTIDPRSRRLQWCSAGHNPVLIHNPHSGEIARLDAQAPPIGVVPALEYETFERQVEPGSLISLYTDGLVEARNADAVEYGLDAVYELIHAHCDGPLTAMTSAMIEAIEGHIEHSPYIRDDVCIVNMRVG
jgi:sigma-B regulation protein RsbU (phosphoserine phosphatase)